MAHLADNEETSTKSISPLDKFYERKQKFNDAILASYDAILEVANETTDCIFTFKNLMSDDIQLFWASVIFLALSLVLRLSIALRQIFQVDEAKRGRYALGVLVSLVEPMSGERIINLSLKVDGKDSYGDTVDVDPMKFLKKKRAEAKSWMFIASVMLLVEDIPELIIDILYVIRNDGGDLDTEFIFSVILTVLHILRITSELGYDLRNYHLLPDLVDKVKGVYSCLISKQWGQLFTSVDLERNNIGDSGAEFLAEVLKLNKGLTRMDLNGNNIGERGAGFIAEALKLNENLVEIYLDDNNIGDKGAGFLAEALKLNKNLEKIFLDDNNIGDSGAGFLAEALKLNKVLTTMGLYGNNISPGGKRALDGAKRDGLHILL